MTTPTTKVTIDSAAMRATRRIEIKFINEMQPIVPLPKQDIDEIAAIIHDEYSELIDAAAKFANHYRNNVGAHRVLSALRKATGGAQ